MKRWTLMLSLVVAFLFAGTLYAENKGAAKIELKGPTKGAVQFDHAKHQALPDTACNKCHHKDAAGKEAKCSGCHDDKAAVKSKEAFHKQCQGCHKDVAKAGKKTGPTMKCAECHK